VQRNSATSAISVQLNLVETCFLANFFSEAGNRIAALFALPPLQLTYFSIPETMPKP
jgi:hypothetical protein